MNNKNDNDDDFPFNDLFSSVEKIFADFDQFFSGFSSVFSIPSEQFNNDHSSSSSTTNLRDEVLKQDFPNNPYQDENLDSTIEDYGLRQSFSNSTTMQRETTPSGRCTIEKKIQQSSTHNDKTKTETITKICGDKHHTTIKQDGKIIREYGNSTLDELDHIDNNNQLI